MEFSDRILTCIECGTDFIFTAGEQVFFHDKQFKNDPKHCKQCKAKRNRGSQRVRPETRTRCSACGADTTVPFKPTQGRPVLCRSCFQKMPKPASPHLPGPAAAQILSTLMAEGVAVVPPALVTEPGIAQVPAALLEESAKIPEAPALVAEPAAGQN